MKLLLVEDDEENIQMIEGLLPSLISPMEIRTARTRDEAITQIDAGFFDLVILDLKIPPTSGSEPLEEHGLAVNGHISQNAPGTMVIFYTAYATIDLATSLVRGTQSQRVFGTSKRPLRDLVRKENARDLFEGLLVEIAAELTELEGVELDCGLSGLALTASEERILRIAAKRKGCTRLVLKTLSGGLSDSKIAICRGTEEGNLRLNGVVRLGRVESIEKEVQAYSDQITPYLRIGAFAHLIDSLTAGAGPTGLAIYGVAENSQTLYSYFQANAESALTVLDAVKACEASWFSGAITRRIRLGDLRREFIGDYALESAAPGIGTRFATAESNEIEMPRCPQHRDLHGSNIMVDPDGHPVLIDFAQADFGPTCLDPVTLELSFVFHPGGKALCGEWPSPDAAQVWDDCDSYVSTAPSTELAEFVKSCREWAVEVAGGYNPVLAVAYSLALKSLKYPDTDNDKLIAIAESAIRRLGF